MAVGRLNSIKTVETEVNKNLELYTSEHMSSNVTIHVTNQGIESGNFTVGLSSSGLNSINDSDYIILGQTLKPREFVSITNVGISSGNTLFCRASKENISFVAFSVFDFVGAGQGFGKENSFRTNLVNNTINTDLLLLTAEEDSNITVSVNNRSFNRSSFSIGISSGGLNEFTLSDYLVFGKLIEKNDSFTLSNLVISANQSIVVRSSNKDIVFSAFSTPIGVTTVSFATTAGSLSGSPNIDVDNVYSTGIVTSVSGFFGDIIANTATFSGNISVAGTVTYEDVTNVDSIGIVTAKSGINITSGGLIVTGVSTFNSPIVGGINITSGGLIVTGVSTFNSPIVGGINISVVQVGYSGTNYIGSAGTTISIGSSSNAYGTRYISVGATPGASIGQNGDIFYVV